MWPCTVVAHAFTSQQKCYNQISVFEAPNISLFIEMPQKTQEKKYSYTKTHELIKVVLFL